MENEFLELMPSTVKIAPFSSYDQYAAPTYGADVTYTCRISLKDELVRSHDGREIAARGRVYLATTTIPGTKDRLTLPAGYVPSTPPILDVQPEQDQLGVHHVMLVIG